MAHNHSRWNALEDFVKQGSGPTAHFQSSFKSDSWSCGSGMQSGNTMPAADYSKGPQMPLDHYGTACATSNAGVTLDLCYSANLMSRRTRIMRLLN